MQLGVRELIEYGEKHNDPAVRAITRRWTECRRKTARWCYAAASKNAEIAQLRDALQELHDAQNGPPLHTQSDIEFWEGAMAKAKMLLREGGEE